jgi:small subunit ribosomal protein S1
MSDMSENFAQLLRESLEKADLRPGAVIKAIVTYVDSDAVIVNAGLKSDAIISIDEFRNDRGDIDVRIGDEVEVIVEAIEDGFGETRLSREKAKRAEAWRTLEKAYEIKQTVIGVITERVKGGFTVSLNSIRAFLPGSLVDVRPVRDPSYLEGKELGFKIIKMDKKRSNVVVSRRAVVEEESGTEREALLETLQEGQVVVGIVKNITDYGAFIDLGGVDGLLHITDMSWKRVKHPSETLTVGEEIKVKVLKYDRDKKRVSLGLKQMGEDPWANIARRYPVNTRLFGKVTNLADYGCFVEIENGIEGLVHMSEMDWTNKNIHPAKVVQIGDEVEVMVLDIDEERRRISLGIKQTQRNPWKEFADKHLKDQKIAGVIKSITDFGIFIGLEGGIDGLVHLSDISWTESGEEAVRRYKKGQEVEAVILAIDPERERISLGIKQLGSDPFSKFIDEHEKGSSVKGKVAEVEAKYAILDLGNSVQGQLRSNDFSEERIKDLREHLKPEEEIEAKIAGVDRKNRIVNLTLREPEQQAPVKPRKPEAPVTTKLGDLLKEQIEAKKDEEG